MQDNFKTAVQQDEKLGLYIVIDREQAFYGNLSNTWLEINGERSKVKPIDLTTELVVILPGELIEKLGIKSGQEISGVISLTDHKEMTIPADVQAAFKAENVGIDCLPLPQQRQGLLFIAESKTLEIRQQRINALIAACAGKKK